ncbi:MAG: Cation efflux system protein [Pseudobdellovibrio sp.]|jgi:cation diffusion facilitator family transporter|nr:Cation efflux system protein [Pseudobdellovibrio sp.]
MSRNIKVALATLVVSVVVLALKTAAYYATYSLAVMSDALETVVNVVTAVVALWAIKFASAPADEDHPYGHGKSEYLSASFEGGLVFFAGMAIAFEAVKSFFVPNTRLDVFNGNSYLVAATVVNLLTGLYLVRHGSKENSEALKASGKHILSDVVTTLGVFAGLVLVKVTGVLWIDSAVGLIVGLYLLFEAYKILKDNTAVLMDAVDLPSLDMLAEVFNTHKIDAVVDIHNVRIIRSGSFHHIDAHVVVPEYLDVATIHEMTHDFEKKVVRDYKYDGEIAFHIDPCKRKFCKQCHFLECKIRREPFDKLKISTQENMCAGPQYTN